MAALAQLRQANQRLRDEETVRGRDAVLATMDDIINGLDGTIKQFAASNELSNAIEILQGGSAGDVSGSYIANARKLEERLGALLPSAWTYCCVQIGCEGEQRIEDTADSNARLHEAITAFEAARKNPDIAVDSSTAAVEGAAKTLADSLLKLRELLVAAGVATATAQ